MSSESNKEYSVNWKNHMDHIRTAFDKLLSSNELVDVTLCCEGHKVGAHKVLLSACSSYFRDIFKEVPCQHPIVFLKGVEYVILSDILHFIYNGQVSVDTSRLNSFLQTARLLGISGLTEADTCKVVGNSLDPNQLPQSQNVTTKSIRVAVEEPESSEPVEKMPRMETPNDNLMPIKSEPNEIADIEQTEGDDDPLESNVKNDIDYLDTSLLIGDEFKNDPCQASTHFISKIPRKKDGKIVRKRCHECYKKHQREKGTQFAVKRTKQVSTQCTSCDKPFCLLCFEKVHKEI